MARGTRRSDVKARLTPRRLSWAGWFLGRVWFGTKIALVIAVVIGAGFWFFAGGYMAQAGRWLHKETVEVTGAMGFKLGNVRVEGRHYIDAETLRNTIAAKLGDPLLSIDINVMQARITALPWVKDVRVRRVWPDKLLISIDERQPLAIWRDAPQGPAVVDSEGVILTRQKLDVFGQLLLVEGAGAPHAAGDLITLLKGQPDIAVRVKKATRVSSRRWDLLLDGGTIIRLPEDDPGFALARASKAQGENKILDQGLKAIDLRQSDRIILEGMGNDKRDLLLKGDKPV